MENIILPKCNNMNNSAESQPRDTLKARDLAMPNHKDLKLCD